MTLNTRAAHPPQKTPPPTPKKVIKSVVGCSLPIHNVTWYLYPYREIENPELYNWIKHLKEPRSSGGNTSSNPQVSAHISRLASNGIERMCQLYKICFTKEPSMWNETIALFLQWIRCRRSGYIWHTRIKALGSAWMGLLSQTTSASRQQTPADRS